MVFEQEVNIFTGNTEKALRQAETEIVQLSDAISMKASATDVYTKQQTEAILEVKANKDTLISEINASADRMKIQADRINITGVITAGSIAQTNDLPTKVSDLTNDSGFVTSSAVPTKVSQLNNDLSFATTGQIPTAVSELSNDLNYASESDIPTKVSQLTNDSKFQTQSDLTSAISVKADKADAVAEEQYIYISKPSGTNTVSQYTTWVTEEGDKQNTWTRKRPTYSTAYPVLFTAKQKKTVSGAVTCTTPIKDDTLTIIDGGHITTGTIDASVVNVTNLDASEIKTGKVKASQIDATDLHVSSANIDGDITIGKVTGLQTALDNESDARKAVYGTSSTASGTQTKAVSLSNFTLYTGASITVKFDNANTNTSPSLNVNSTGSKAIRSYTGGTLTQAEYGWVAGAAITFTYDGTYWRIQDSGTFKAKADAQASATQASGYASTASTKASEASTSANTASTKASEAASSASTASTKASDASASASTASTKASEASSSASTASTKASQASQSATDAVNAKNTALEAVDWTIGIEVTTINYTGNTATLKATVYKGGVVQSSGFTLQWYKGGTTISGGTSATLNVNDLEASYTCIAS